MLTETIAIQVEGSLPGARLCIYIQEKKLGIVGLGHTGFTTARIAIGFGMKVCAYTSKIGRAHV